LHGWWCAFFLKKKRWQTDSFERRVLSLFLFVCIFVVGFFSGVSFLVLGLCCRLLDFFFSTILIFYRGVTFDPPSLIFVDFLSSLFHFCAFSFGMLLVCIVSRPLVLLILFVISRSLVFPRGAKGLCFLR